MADPGDQHPLWLGAAPLVLASGSRTRFDLLISAGLPVELLKPSVDERALAAPLEKSLASPREIAEALAVAKALSVSTRHTGRIVLGADQTLACAGVMLHKPASLGDAADQLAFLSGKTHQLCSAVAIAQDNRAIAVFSEIATLTVRTLSVQMIARYLESAGDNVMSSVGGYQIEGLGIHLFDAIDGDHTTICGLPMIKTLLHLRRLGLVVE
jgi:septum formation protein